MNMINSPPSPMDEFVEAATVLSNTVTGTINEVANEAPVIGNAIICADSLSTTSRADVNFVCAPTRLARTFFGVSCVFGVMGAASSDAALASTCAGIPVAGWVGSFGARGFNRAGKYALQMGNVTSGNITNTTEIVELMANG